MCIRDRHHTMSLITTLVTIINTQTLSYNSSSYKLSNTNNICHLVMQYFTKEHNNHLTLIQNNINPETHIKTELTRVLNSVFILWLWLGNITVSLDARRIIDLVSKEHLQCSRELCNYAPYTIRAKRDVATHVPYSFSKLNIIFLYICTLTLL